MKEAIIGGVFALLGSLITFLGTFLANLNTKKEKRNRERMKTYLEEIKAFYNLEQLYMNEVAELRSKIPDAQESIKPLGIQREFRRKNEENGNVTLTMTSAMADKMLSNID